MSSAEAWVAVEEGAPPQALTVEVVATHVRDGSDRPAGKALDLVQAQAIHGQGAACGLRQWGKGYRFLPLVWSSMGQGQKQCHLCLAGDLVAFQVSELGHLTNQPGAHFNVQIKAL